MSKREKKEEDWEDIKPSKELRKACRKATEEELRRVLRRINCRLIVLGPKALMLLKKKDEKKRPAR